MRQRANESTELWMMLRELAKTVDAMDVARLRANGHDL